MTKNNKVKEQSYIVGYYGGRLFPGVKQTRQKLTDRAVNSNTAGIETDNYVKVQNNIKVKQ